MIVVKKDFLDETVLNEILMLTDTKVNSFSPEWYTNQSWPEGIRRGCGTVCVLPLDSYVKPIKDALCLVDKKYGEYKLRAQLYLWTPGSFIPWHRDGNKDLGCTIYLNKNWDQNSGGIYLYKGEEMEIRGEFPEFNKLVLNDSNVEHHVTMIPNSCMENRITLQVWGWKKTDVIGFD